MLAETPDRALQGLGDPSALVRRTAMEATVESGRPGDVQTALQRCLECGWVDSLGDACRQVPEAKRLLLAELESLNPESSRARVALEAIAAT